MIVVASDEHTAGRDGGKTLQQQTGFAKAPLARVLFSTTRPEPTGESRATAMPGPSPRLTPLHTILDKRDAAVEGFPSGSDYR